MKMDKCNERWRQSETSFCCHVRENIPISSLCYLTLLLPVHGVFQGHERFSYCPGTIPKRQLLKKENPRGHCILPPWSRSQNANPTCSPFSLVSLPCTSQCTGSASWTPHPYPARQCHNDDLQKQTPTCLWSGGQPALEKLVLGQIWDAAQGCSMVWKHTC